jgi:demethylmacrocin O-methyltransferase
MFTLDEIAIHHGADKASPYHGYTAVYARLFRDLRCLPIRLLEIGIEYGKSMRTWLDYFPQATIIGVDINPQFSDTHPRLHLEIADQYNSAQMAQLAARYNPLDVVIDDGCHKADAVKVSFEALWPEVRPGGLYIIEDVGTFYHPMYQSAVEGPIFLHSFVDDVHQRGRTGSYGLPPYGDNPTQLSAMEATLDCLFFFKGMAVLRKK